MVMGMPAPGIRRPSARHLRAEAAVLHRPSPNFGPRKNGLLPEIVVIHYTAMQSAEAAIARLSDPAAEVSAHYIIDRLGAVTRLVDEEHRAWHAGVGAWRGLEDINSRSIGIELDNTGAHPFPEPQMAALETLLRDIVQRWEILPTNVIGHSDMAPGRKTDPGPRFDWARLQMRGLAAWSDLKPVTEQFRDRFDLAECAELLAEIGYTADGPLSAKLQSFRDRFLPASEGPPNGADRLMMLSYLNDFGAA